MADDEEEDLYDDEFDFVDDLDDEDEDVSEPAEVAEDDADEVAPRAEVAATRDDFGDVPDDVDDAPEEDPYATPPPAANYVVHVYEHRQFKRTIDRPFTGEDAEAFASEYNRTAKPYGRFALAGKNDAKPHKSLDDR